MKLMRSSVLLLAMILAGCGGSSDTTNPGVQTANSIPSASANAARFAVFSDPHLYDTTVLGSGADLDAYLLQDRKMIKDSSEILDSVIGDLKSNTLDFVLITGDLTKDGELVNHQLMANKLMQLKTSGKKVFVVPGNHDIYNPDAKDYSSSPAKATAQTSPDEFRKIYKDFGYGDAIYTDSNSLSYIAEPVNGVWLFAIDSCQYTSASTAPITAGKIGSATQAWIVSKLQEAQQKGKQVIGMMHHGIVEHYTGQATAFPEYVISNNAAIGKQLADNGLNVMFTGHYHANDVASTNFTSSTLYDVETGSTVTAPSPYRVIDFNITGKQLAITSRAVGKTTSHPTDFVSYARNYLVDGMTTLTKIQLASPPYNLDAKTAAGLAPMVANAFAAHYAGDEKLADTTTIATLQSMLASSNAGTKTLGQSIYSLWTDTGPADNTVTLSLGTK